MSAAVDGATVDISTVVSTAVDKYVVAAIVVTGTVVANVLILKQQHKRPTEAQRHSGQSVSQCQSRQTPQKRSRKGFEMNVRPKPTQL